MHFVDVVRIVGLNFSKCHARYLSCQDGIGPRANIHARCTGSHLAPLLSQLSLGLDLLKQKTNEIKRGKKRNNKKGREKNEKRKKHGKSKMETKKWKQNGTKKKRKRERGSGVADGRGRGAQRTGKTRARGKSERDILRGYG